MNRLKELRRAKGLTQEEIARLLGVQKAAICKYETGRVAIPPDTLVVLCDFFGVTADYMLCREEPVLVSPQFKPTASLSPRFLYPTPWACPWLDAFTQGCLCWLPKTFRNTCRSPQQTSRGAITSIWKLRGIVW